jgi:filamentous hemagglutinin family protein
MASMNRLILGAAWAAMALAAPGALANPTGGVVTSGQATIQQNGNTLQVTTTTPSTTINWQNFSIGAGETTNITQPNASSVTLNQVMTQSPSQIFGSLTSNGQVFLINPNGVVFGAGAQVNTAALNITAGFVSFALPFTYNDSTTVLAGPGFSGGPVTLNTTSLFGQGSTTNTAGTFSVAGSTMGGNSGITFAGTGVTLTTSGSTSGSISSSGGITATGGTPPTGAAASSQSVSSSATAGTPAPAPATPPGGAKVVLVKQEPAY